MKESKISEGTPISRSESALLGANKSSHAIFKSYVDASAEYSEHKKITVTPRIRVIYVYEPKIIRTDPQNFRSLVQKLTGKSIHKSKEKKREMIPKSQSLEVVSAVIDTEIPENTFYRNDQIPIRRNKGTNLISTEDCTGSTKGFNDTNMIFPDMPRLGLLQEIPLVWNNSPFL